MRLRLLALLGICAIAGVAAAHAEWRSTDEAAAAVILSRDRGANPFPRLRTACPLPTRFRPAFVRAADETGLPLSLLVAIAETESQFDAGAISRADARGLLQVLPATGASLRLNVDAPATNVLAGALYLRMLVDRFRTADLAIAAYNAGPTAVAKAGGAPSPETATYVANVDARWQLLAACDGA
jgi:soluble lytic murein transglycosylase-like protein